MALKLDQLDLQVLRDLLGVLRSAGTRSFLIGAGARRLTMDGPGGLRGARATLDWDFAVRVESWRAWEELRARLLSGPEPLFHAASSAHRIRHACGQPIDLVPYGALESAPGRITWPDGTEMTVHGFLESETRLHPVEIEPGLRLDSASIPSLAVLKLFAYAERRLRGETKDIRDFDWLLVNYEHAGNEDRIHVELRDALIDGVIDAEHAGAMLLGRDAALIHAAKSIEALRVLFDEARDPRSQLVQDIVTQTKSADELRGRRARRCRPQSCREPDRRIRPRLRQPKRAVTTIRTRAAVWRS